MIGAKMLQNIILVISNHLRTYFAEHFSVLILCPVHISVDSYCSLGKVSCWNFYQGYSRTKFRHTKYLTIEKVKCLRFSNLLSCLWVLYSGWPGLNLPCRPKYMLSSPIHHELAGELAVVFTHSIVAVVNKRWKYIKNCSFLSRLMYACQFNQG